MDSILTSIKKLLGLEEEYTHFDADIIIHINSALFRLSTLGVGPLIVSDKSQVWSDLITEVDDLEAIKTYIYLKVKIIFDPPQTSFVIEAYKSQMLEMEWLINEKAGGGLDE